MTQPYPHILQVVLDTTDARRLAEFYRQLFGLEYRAGDEPPADEPPADEPPADGQPDPGGSDWLVLRGAGGGPQLAFQQTAGVRPSTWPDAAVPQMYHLDTTVSSREELATQRERALALGATELLDRTDDADEPLYVLADLDGHPFCIFVSQE
jgi:catechol 2,3-dioxygenase-like lactoylglutathione lyase family enzyme